MTTSAPPMHPLVALMRGFVVDWLECADPDACAARVMAPGYVATVGGVTLSGLDAAYLPATLEQLRRFPGLLVTVHDLFATEDRVALRFTEHGYAADRGAAAAWAGIGIFGWDGSRLTDNVTEEDYLSRRRQLAAGVADPVATPATAPWATVPAGPDPRAEQAVRAWLATGDLTGGGSVMIDDGWTGQPTPELVRTDHVDIDTLFSAGRMVAFHLTQRGRYLGGLDLAPAPDQGDVGLRCTGMVEVADDGTVRGHLVRDRVGLRRELVAARSDPA